MLPLTQHDRYIMLSHDLDESASPNYIQVEWIFIPFYIFIHKLTKTNISRAYNFWRYVVGLEHLDILQNVYVS